MNGFKVCLHLEQEGLIKISGIGSAFTQQQKALKKAKINYTTNPNEEFDILHVNFWGPKSYYLVNKYKKLGKKIIIHTHATAEDLKNSFRGSNLVAGLFKKYLKKYYDKADLLIAPSEYTKKLLEDEYGLKHKKIIAISNGVDFEKFENHEKLRGKYRKKYGLSGISFFSVGHLFKRKGVHDFVNIGKINPEVKFIWFGPIYNRIFSDTKKIIQKKPDNIIFSGFVEDIKGAYAAGDIFLFPSYGENQGIVVLEAAATKHPIIVRNLPAYNGWLVHNENAIICSNNKEFQNAVKLLLKDKKFREKLANNAFQMSKEHSLNKIGNELKKAYLSLH